MLSVVAEVAAGDWPAAIDWALLADRAAGAALAQTPFAGLAHATIDVEVSVLFSDDAEVQCLNRDYRGKDKPTNVLSFPMLEPAEIAAPGAPAGGELLLGDIVLAAETVAREASEKRISVADHATHLIVHGLLHLLGYDHEDEGQAEHMEALETRALATMGVGDPYAALA